MNSRSDYQFVYYKTKPSTTPYKDITKELDY